MGVSKRDTTIVFLTFGIVLTIVFAGLFAWEYTQQTKSINEVYFSEWKHVNKVFDYNSTGEEEILLSCPANKNLLITDATFQVYDPLETGESSWKAASETDKHIDSYWISYNKIKNYDGGIADDSYIGQCNFAQRIPGQLNQQCGYEKGDCTVRVNKNGEVTWSEQTAENVVCSDQAICRSENSCKFSVQVSYICDSEEAVQQMVTNDQSKAT